MIFFGWLVFLGCCNFCGCLNVGRRSSWAGVFKGLAVSVPFGCCEVLALGLEFLGLVGFCWWHFEGFYQFIPCCKVICQIF